MTDQRGLTVTSATDPDVASAMVIFERMKPLQDALGCKDLTEPELQVFAMVCHHTGLDPFTKQIHAIKRGGRVTHQTGIDGYRSTAERTHEYRGSDEAEYEICDCGDKGSPAVHPALARVIVYRAYPDGIRPQVGIARWHELKPDHKQNKSGFGWQDDMWWQQPFGQLSKCAEAAGLRKAFPRVFGGVYIAEEMQRADTIEGAAVEVAPTAAERLAAKRAKAAPAVVVAEAAPGETAETEAVEGEAVEVPTVDDLTAAADAAGVDLRAYALQLFPDRKPGTDLTDEQSVVLMARIKAI